MKTSIKDIIYEILEDKAVRMPNLSLVDNTRGTNCTLDRTSWSIIGFESKEELAKVEQELSAMLKETVAKCTDEEERKELGQLNVTRQALYKRSGWALWEVTEDNTKEEIYDLLTIRDGEDIHIYGVDAYYKEVDFIENEINKFELLSHCRSFDEIRKIYIQMKNLWDALQEVEEDEILVRNNIYNTYEVEKRFVTQFSEGYQHFAIGLSII